MVSYSDVYLDGNNQCEMASLTEKRSLFFIYFFYFFPPYISYSLLCFDHNPKEVSCLELSVLTENTSDWSIALVPLQSCTLAVCVFVSTCLCVCPSPGPWSRARRSFASSTRRARWSFMEWSCTLPRWNHPSEFHSSFRLVVIRLSDALMRDTLSSSRLHLPQDSNNTSLMVGLTSSGVAIFRNMICSSFFPWCVLVTLRAHCHGVVVKALTAPHCTRSHAGGTSSRFLSRGNAFWYIWKENMWVPPKLLLIFFNDQPLNNYRV